MTKHSYPKRSIKAFALVELLVAIAILAIVITVVHTTFYTGIKAYHRTQAELSLNQEINQILDKLSVELRNCYGADYNEKEDKGGFVADSQSISFFTIQNVYSQGSFKKLLASISYRFSDGKLFKKVQLDKDAFLGEGDFREEELISDIKQLDLQYLYFKKVFSQGEYRYEWKSEWQDKSLIPQGIKIEVTREEPKQGISVSLTRYIFIMQGEIPAQK